jgi:hypothetical protein
MSTPHRGKKGMPFLPGMGCARADWANSARVLACHSLYPFEIIVLTHLRKK